MPPRHHRRALAPIAFVACLGLAVPGLANDSAAELAAGGLVLVKTDGIAMQREDLTISPSAVRVRYEMRNDTGKPMTLRVAFPMPDVPPESPNGPQNAAGGTVNIETPTHPDFLRFRVRVDGKDVTPEVEVKALLPDGRDVTAEVGRIGGMALLMQTGVFLRDDTISPDAEWRLTGTDRKLLSSADRRALRDIGAIELFDGQAGYRLPWTTKITFHWMQDFKPGITVVEHDYRPVIGWRFITASAGAGPITASGGGDPMRDFCIDAATDKAIRAMRVAQDARSRTRPGEETHLTGYTLGYILKTARNWQGPIGTFRLVVEGGTVPEASGRAGGAGQTGVMSLCTDLPLTRTDPNRFEATVRDYVPKEDLRILYVKR